MWLAIGKELDQEGFREALASWKKGRRGFVIDEDVFNRMSCDLETYVRLLSLVGSGRLKVRRDCKGRRIGHAAFTRRGEVGSGALEQDRRVSEKFCPKCYLFRTSEETFCTTCGTKLKEMKLDNRKG